MLEKPSLSQKVLLLLIESTHWLKGEEQIKGISLITNFAILVFDNHHVNSSLPQFVCAIHNTLIHFVCVLILWTQRATHFLSSQSILSNWPPLFVLCNHVSIPVPNVLTSLILHEQCSSKKMKTTNRLTDWESCPQTCKKCSFNWLKLSIYCRIIVWKICCVVLVGWALHQSLSTDYQLHPYCIRMWVSHNSDTKQCAWHKDSNKLYSGTLH